MLTSLGLVLLFAMLGTAYVGFMSVEYDTVRYEVQNRRIETLSEAGIHAAIGELAAAVQDGATPAASYTFEMPLYRWEADGTAEYTQTVTVRVEDESAKLNVNHLSREALAAAGFEYEAINALRLKLPIPSVPSMEEERRWLSSVDELRSRGIVDGKTFALLPAEHFTVHTALDPSQPEGLINLNAAPPAVLAIIFGVDPVEAGTLASKRPFTGWQDVLAKVAREPGTFNVRAPEFDLRSMPQELALESRCFRLTSEVASEHEALARPGVHASVEAIVLIPENGDPIIRFWTDVPAAERGIDSDLTKTTPQAPEEAAAKTVDPAAEDPE